MTTIIHELDSGTYQEPDGITLAAWLNEWLTTFCKNKVKPLSYQAYEGLIRNHISPAIGKMKLQDVKGIHILRLYNQMSDNGFSAKTIKMSLSSFTVHSTWQRNKHSSLPTPPKVPNRPKSNGLKSLPCRTRTFPGSWPRSTIRPCATLMPSACSQD